ncbi:MAG TPA: pantoate--beta-alanine ligase [Capsulimonadaceae bacterium]|nr:pantoate--beta-alanine ligase [Capsulimonadaceae bacterium]
MHTYERIANLREALNAARGRGKAVGFVPTMGALHEGHLSLVRRARDENDLVVMSVFVNPTQFNDPSDFEKYPRDLERDKAMAAGAGADIVFSPAREEIYPEGFATGVTVHGLTDILEGASRPGHFQGVATVVAKLLNIAQPDRAYFGEKDYQQLQVILRMAADLNIPTDIVACPTLREADGLALSSRNVRLSPEERKAAVVLSRALRETQKAATRGERDARKLAGALARQIEAEPLAKLDYAVIADPESLREVERIEGKAIALVAAVFGGVRLIDNAGLGTHPSRNGWGRRAWHDDMWFTPFPGQERKRFQGAFRLS